MKLHTHLHLIQTLKMSAAISLFTLYVFRACLQTTLPPPSRKLKDQNNNETKLTYYKETTMPTELHGRKYWTIQVATAKNRTQSADRKELRLH